MEKRNNVKTKKNILLNISLPKRSRKEERGKGGEEEEEGRGYCEVPLTLLFMGCFYPYI